MRLPAFVLGVLSWGGLVACGDTRHQEGPACPLCNSTSEVAGGESSEFSGGERAGCTEVVSTTPLDLGDPELAPWLALASGHHELSLRWTPMLPDGRVQGYEPSTRVELDVTVLLGEDVVFGDPQRSDADPPGCIGSRQRRFELEIQLATADGALDGSFRERVTPQLGQAGKRQLTALWARGMTDLPASFTGTLDLGAEPSAPWLPRIDFDADSARGVIAPLVSLPGDSPTYWSPIAGKFPDDGCAYGYAVPLDEAHALLGATPRAAYERARSRWQGKVVEAAWVSAASSPAATLTWTEVALSTGAPTLACFDGGIGVYAPLGVQSADGLVEVEPLAQVYLAPARSGGGNVYANVAAEGRWIRATEFEPAVGMHGVDLEGAEYGALSLSHADDPDDDELRGELHVEKWLGFGASPTAQPVLHWCTGPSCERRWCVLGTDFPDRDCASLLAP